MRLKGRVAIVAGVGLGRIGAAIAYRFALEGAHLIINNRGRADKLDETARWRGSSTRRGSRDEAELPAGLAVS